MVLFQYSLLKFATKDSTLADGIDASQAPDKDVIEKEKAALKKLLPLVEKFVHEKVALQVSCLCFVHSLLRFWPSLCFSCNDLKAIEDFVRSQRDLCAGSYDRSIAFRFCYPAFATLRLRGRPGRDGCKVHCRTFWGTHFQHGGKFVPQNSPTMHFDNHLDPVSRATSKWRIEARSFKRYVALSTIWCRHYPVHKYEGSKLCYPVDWDFFCGLRYPPFEQLGRGSVVQ